MGFIMLLTLYPNRPHMDTISNNFAPNLHGESENWGPLHKGMLHSEANFGEISLLYGVNICSGGNPGPIPKHCEKTQIYSGPTTFGRCMQKILPIKSYPYQLILSGALDILHLSVTLKEINSGSYIEPILLPPVRSRVLPGRNQIFLHTFQVSRHPVIHQGKTLFVHLSWIPHLRHFQLINYSVYHSKECSKVKSIIHGKKVHLQAYVMASIWSYISNLQRRGADVHILLDGVSYNNWWSLVCRWDHQSPANRIQNHVNLSHLQSWKR